MDAYSDVTIEIELMIHDTEGLILYNGQKEDDKGDFISLAVIGGFVEFRYVPILFATVTIPLCGSIADTTLATVSSLSSRKSA